MCVSPNHVWVDGPLGYKKQLVPCNACWACLKNKVWDLTGRVLCEYANQDWARTITLTYDDKKLRDPTQTEILHLRDFEEFRQRLKHHFPQFRYIAAGEYGKEKGRTHWHILMMGRGTPPDVPNNNKQRFHWKLWPWGHCTAEHGATEKSIRYVAKYLVKHKANLAQMKEGQTYRKEWLGYSKKPLLGHDFIVHMAQRHAEARVYPRDFNYMPPGGNLRQKWRYTFQGKAQEVFHDALFEAWPQAYYYPGRTEWMENAFKRYVRKKAQDYWDSYCVHLNANHANHQIWWLLDIEPRTWAKKELTKLDRKVQELRDHDDLFRGELERARERWLDERQQVEDILATIDIPEIARRQARQRLHVQHGKDVQRRTRELSIEHGLFPGING
jgi:hypothetical protein